MGNREEEEKRKKKRRGGVNRERVIEKIKEQWEIKMADRWWKEIMNILFDE